MRFGAAVAGVSLGLSAILASCARRGTQVTHADLPCAPDSTAPRPAVLRRAAGAELRGEIGAAAPGGLVVHVDSSASQRPIERAVAFFEGTGIGAYTDSAGWAVLTAPPDAYTLRVRRIGYADQRVPIELRAGYRDTVSLGLGAVRVCLQVEARE